MKFTLLTLIFCFFLSACNERDKTNINIKKMPYKRSEDGIYYKIVTVEGRKFIATQSSYGYWVLAGPL